MRDVAKLLAGMTVLLVLILSVIKPLIRSLMTPPVVALPPGTNSEPGNEGQGRVALQGKNYEEQINEARALVNQDPARVAQVVNSWVSGND